MKVLLINPNNTHVIESNFPRMLDEGVGLFPPLGLLYIASFLKSKNRHSVSVLDMPAEGLNLSRLKNLIKDSNPDIVGIYTTTLTLIDVFLTVKTIKESNPNTYIALGGPHVNIYPEETISDPDIDFIILGEGEVSFCELTDALEDKKSLSHIKGLIYKKDGRVVKTAPPELISNLDSLPFPDRRMIPYERYYNILSHNYPSLTMITSRGCPYTCTFCYHSLLGKYMRFRSPDNIISEIEECLSLGIKDIFFCDETFTLDQERAVNICDGIIARNLKFNWRIKTRVDSLNIDILTKLKEAGCEQICFGVESGSPKVLKALNKGITVEQIRKTFALTKKIGIETVAYFMLGSPTEDKKDILDTINFVIKLAPDYPHFSITTPYPGTDLYKMGLETKIIKNDFWREFAVTRNASFSPKFWEENLSERELLGLLKYANWSFYLRPGYLFKVLLKSSSHKDLGKKAKMGVKFFKYLAVGEN